MPLTAEEIQAWVDSFKPSLVEVDGVIYPCMSNGNDYALRQIADKLHSVNVALADQIRDALDMP